MVQVQNWNNLLQYIKTQLGAQINFLEMDDSQIVDYLFQHTLPTFSTYFPTKIWTYISNDYNQKTMLTDMYSENVYELKIPEDVKIVDVAAVYQYSEQFIGAVFTAANIYFYDPRDIAMANTFNDMMKFLTPLQVYYFIPPNILRLSRDLIYNGAIVELDIVHRNLNTITHDKYNKMLKPMALRDIIELLISIRSKYQNVQTPYGEINLNIDFLQTKKQDIDQKLEQEMQWIHPQILVDFF